MEESRSHDSQESRFGKPMGANDRRLMRRSFIALAAAALAATAGAAAETVPSWAFFFPQEGKPQNAADEGTLTLPGSPVRLTRAEVDNLKKPPDWFPSAHVAPPAAVVQGNAAPLGFACSACHLMSGMGQPESSSLAGEPTAYLARQMSDFRTGARANAIKGADGKPQNNGVQVMIGIAKAWPESDANAAIEYFASLKPKKWVKVVEAKSVPRTYINHGYKLLARPEGGTEQLGARIVELAQNVERQLLRDPNSGTIAYVPIGSVRRGKVLVSRGEAQCGACHGADLRGNDDIPSIAGRSPLYIFRQLYFLKDRSRNGSMASLMYPAVDTLTQSQMIDVAAYLATLPP